MFFFSLLLFKQAKNRAPAQIQITAEQLIREAQEHREDKFEATRQQITDQDELMEYRKNKRTSFEAAIRRNRYNIGAWINYAKWEVSQKEFTRARSVFERALEVEPQNAAIWLRYADMETEQTFLNHARNLYERACGVLPRHDALWFKWAYLEEKIGNIPGARNVYERFMSWLPDVMAWETYINFEIRHQNLPGARAVFEKFIVCHNTVEAYLKYARFEAKHGQPARARVVYERAIVELEEDANDTRFFIAFAEFEEFQKEYERARMVYKQGLARVSKIAAHELFTRYSQFEKQRGSTDSIEDVIAAKKRLEFEEALEKNPMDYDTWFDYIRLEEHAASRALELALEYVRAQQLLENKSSLLTTSSTITNEIASEMHDLTDSIEIEQDQSDNTMSEKEQKTASLPTVTFSAIPESVRDNIHSRVRALYSRAVLNKPPSATIKQLWRRYIYLWLNYAVYEELVAKNTDKAHQVFQTCLEIIPHQNFTFSKAWILAAELEIRRGNLSAARKLLGTSIGKCPREKIFRAYISMERKLGHVERCSTLYHKMLETFSTSAEAWISLATFEMENGEPSRARGVYELALKQADTASPLDKPFAVWAAYLEMEKSLGNETNVRDLYKRMIEANLPGQSTVDIWVDWVKYTAKDGTEQALDASRAIFSEADAAFKQNIALLTQANMSIMTQAAQATLANVNAVTDTAEKTSASNASGAMSSAVSTSLSALIDMKEERFKLLEQWRAFESELSQYTGNDQHLQVVLSKIPQRVKKTRIITNELGAQTGTQEYFDYIFADDRESGKSSKKLLDFAQKWKLKKNAMKQE